MSSKTSSKPVLSLRLIVMLALLLVLFCSPRSTEAFEASLSRIWRHRASVVFPIGTSTASSSSNNVPLFRSASMRATLINTPSAASSRISKIKEITLQREMLNDITAAEFALTIEMRHQNDSTMIDYERLIAKLDRNLNILRMKEALNESNQRFLTRMENIKQELILASQNLPPLSSTSSNTESSTSTPNEMAIDTSDANKEVIASSLRKKGEAVKESLRILIREDGFVDWDGALASSKEVAKFGTELWERLNGKEEGTPSFAELFSPAPAKFPNTPEIEQLTIVTNNIRQELALVSKRAEEVRNKIRQAKTPAMMKLEDEDVATLRKLDGTQKELEKKLKVFVLNLDMEKICAYLQQEIEASSDPAEQKLLIAEVSLIDKQLNSIMGGLQLTSEQMNAISYDDVVINGLISLMDEDELNIIVNEVNDLKNRLGLDTQLLTAFDWGSFGKVVTETLNKVKAGLSFFGAGTKMLVSDIQYAWSLITKAAIQGYTLKPREVNAIRRTGKDLLTLIPFTIILIIPLSPIGHVLVFSFIQRFFPEFYPSCYTEKRLNLRKLFAEIERKKQIDLLADIGPAPSLDWNEKISQLKNTNVVQWINGLNNNNNNNDTPNSNEEK